MLVAGLVVSLSGWSLCAQSMPLEILKQLWTTLSGTLPIFLVSSSWLSCGLFWMVGSLAPDTMRTYSCHVFLAASYFTPFMPVDIRIASHITYVARCFGSWSVIFWKLIFLLLRPSNCALSLAAVHIPLSLLTKCTILSRWVIVLEYCARVTCIMSKSSESLPSVMGQPFVATWEFR